MVTPKVKKASLKFGNMTVYTGYVVVTTKESKYLYSKYCDITRLTENDAMNDAILLKRDIEYIPERVE